MTFVLTGAVLAFIDPAWAIPANTFLLICMVWVQQKARSEAKQDHKEVKAQTQETVTAAEHAASKAAEAVTAATTAHTEILDAIHSQASA